MGCNCGGKKPIGSSGASTNTTTPKKPWYSPPKTQYTLRIGSTVQTFGSQLEANAAQRRLGGGTVSPRR